MVRFSDINWPTAPRYWLVNARVPACLLADSPALTAPADEEGVVCLALLIENGMLARIEPQGKANESDTIHIDLGGRQVWPTLVDIHTHLDKCHTVERSPNVDGTFHNARLAAAADRANWTKPDLRRRMDFGLRCAYAHGVSAIRTHIDTYPETAERSWSVVREIREQWRGRVDIQAVSLCPIDLLQDGFGDQVASIVARSGGLLGGVTRAALGNHAAPSANIEGLLDRLFALAGRHGLGIDLHVDETLDPAAATLPFIARAALRNRYNGGVVCGHCCSLSMQPAAEVDRTLDLLAQAEIAVVTLPTVNMYLQDREKDRTPRLRGATIVHEMLRRGIRVAAAGDNCRDSFYAYGDHDVVDTFRQSVRILHFDHPLTGAPALVGATPSQVGQFEGHGQLKLGTPARLIVFNARTINEIVSRPQADRAVIAHGQKINAKVPGYDELWEMEGAVNEAAAQLS
jgi:cytosine/creatinine deaminase